MPPLKTLIAFESAVRHASFKLAAKELHLTPGAISQQVVKLEQWLGVKLFVRETRQLSITQQGASYYASITPALAQINNASEMARQQPQRKVCLSLTQTLAAKWLGPRLSEFMGRYPDIEVHINASNSLVDFKTEGVDLAIRHFDGKDPHLESELIHEDQVCVFCSPSYASLINLEQATQLTQSTLIVTALHPYWEMWLESIDKKLSTQYPAMTKLHLDQTLLAIDAAKRGQGLVLSNLFLVQDELENGELVEPFKNRLNLNKSYYIVQPKHAVLSQPAQRLKDWILEQFNRAADQ